MTINTLRSALLVFVGLSLACASTGRDGSQRARQDELSRMEIESVDAGDLYDVVQRLRPRWLTEERRAGERSFGLATGIVVYHDQTFLGNVSVLREWSSAGVYGLRWLDAAEASATLPGLGSQHVAGAIIISTRPES